MSRDTGSPIAKREIGVITRREFVVRYMNDYGCTYAQACRIYSVMINVIEEGIIAGNKILFGNIGAVVPVWRPSRDVHMHFRRGKGGKIERGVRRTYHMDGRFGYKLKLYQRFLSSHRMKWFLDFPTEP